MSHDSMPVAVLLGDDVDDLFWQCVGLLRID